MKRIFIFLVSLTSLLLIIISLKGDFQNAFYYGENVCVSHEGQELLLSKSTARIDHSLLQGEQLVNSHLFHQGEGFLDQAAEELYSFPQIFHSVATKFPITNKENTALNKVNPHC